MTRDGVIYGSLTTQFPETSQTCHPWAFVVGFRAQPYVAGVQAALASSTGAAVAAAAMVSRTAANAFILMRSTCVLDMIVELIVFVCLSRKILVVRGSYVPTAESHGLISAGATPWSL